MCIQSVRMNTVLLIKGWMIPKDAKIVNEKHLENCTYRLEPRMQAKGPAKMTDTLAKWGSRSGDKDMLATCY